MDIETAEARRIQDRLRQDQPVGRNHGHVSLQGGKGFTVLRIAEVQRRADGQTQFLGCLLHRAGTRLLPPPRRARRLTVDRHDIVTGSMQRAQRRNGEVGCAHVDDAQGLRRV